MLDVAIIGGGPAGMNASLVAARAKMTVMMFDEELARNRVTQHSHGWIGFDGRKPSEIRREARKDLAKYPNITVMNERVEIVSEQDAYFVITTTSGQYEAKRVILTTGYQESFPSIQGIRNYYGRNLFSCPFCDGYELANKEIVIVADNPHAMFLTKLVYTYNQDIVLMTNNAPVLSEEEIASLSNLGVIIETRSIDRLIESNGNLEGFQFSDGAILHRKFGFVATIPRIDHNFISQLKLQTNDSGFIIIDSMGRTSHPGVYAAGDITGPSNLIGSAYQGSMAATGIIFDYVESGYN